MCKSATLKGYMNTCNKVNMFYPNSKKQISTIRHVNEENINFNSKWLICNGLCYVNLSTSHHDNVPNIKLNKINNLLSLQVKLDCVISFDERISVEDGASITNVDVWNPF